MKPLTLSMSILALLASPVALAASNMKTINVEAGYHHIGDGNDPMFKNPAPEGTSYEKKITLQSFVELATVGFIEFIILELYHSDILINGRTISIPLPLPPEKILSDPYQTSLISIPAGFFKSGVNSITFQSRTDNGGGFDDIEFGEVKLYFQ